MTERYGVTVATGSLKPEHGPVVKFRIVGQRKASVSRRTSPVLTSFTWQQPGASSTTSTVRRKSSAFP